MRHRNRIIGAFATALLAALLLPVLFGDPATVEGRTGGDAWRNLIYDFQTLIAGFFAVLAAWWTVFTMNRTERADAERHAQQIDLALRGDKLKIDRALYPQFRELNDTRKLLASVLQRHQTASKDPTDGGSPLRFFIDDICGEIEAIDALLKRPHFIDGALLFDGDLNHRIWDLSRRVGTALPQAQKSARYYNEPQKSYEQDHRYDEWYEAGGENDIVTFCNYFVNHSPAILDGMRTIAALYDVRRS
ncbi:hypothetical protein [Rhizobium leguminosarum]|uniref:hypothetical protein n=1 Tax=Rhizobium leguminosarum TaxID=384 RepID=UPI003F9A7438